MNRPTRSREPYGQALVELARRRPEVVCLSGDLTRQCEVDLFQAEFPDRFIQCGMAEANMLGVAGALARCGHLPFVHTFGVFATRRPLDQIISAIGYPGLPVRIIGFMPGISSPGGPSHQAIDDVALMRAVPGMTVLDVADAIEVRQVCTAIADLPGPVYVRLKRGEVPVIFGDDHVLSLHRAQVLSRGGDVALFASGMMLAPALAAARVLGGHGVAVSVVNVPVLKPLDTSTVLDVATAARVALTAETTGHRRAGHGRRGNPGRGPAGPPGAPDRAARHVRRGRAQRGVPVRPVRPVRPVDRGRGMAGPGQPGPVPEVHLPAADPGEYAPV